MIIDEADIIISPEHMGEYSVPNAAALTCMCKMEMNAAQRPDHFLQPPTPVVPPASTKRSTPQSLRIEDLTWADGTAVADEVFALTVSSCRASAQLTSCGDIGAIDAGDCRRVNIASITVEAPKGVA